MKNDRLNDRLKKQIFGLIICRHKFLTIERENTADIKFPFIL